jgi:WD40 repeat protein
MLKIWDPITGACELTLKGHTSYVLFLIILPDGRPISGSVDKTLRVWNPQTGSCELVFKGHRDCILPLTILPDGRPISGSSDCTLKIWNPSKGKCVRTLRGHDSSISSLTILPGGRLISAAGNQLKIWDVSTGNCELTLTDDHPILGKRALVFKDFSYNFLIYCLAILPDGRPISSSAHGLKIWNFPIL